ncbi:MAG: (Fe-S)-binding protein [Cyanobacteria bacterium HKST-UBA06]|nr:(Fe-S)-binding protein [Cyanobacteria bacterium HKST-UBA06]
MTLPPAPTTSPSAQPACPASAADWLGHAVGAETFPDKLSACIHCGMCLPACPTYRITGSEAESPRGRIYLMGAMQRGELTDARQLADHLDPCLGCLACTSACPSGVDYEALLMGARSALVSRQPFYKRWLRWVLLGTVLPNPVLLLAATHMVRLAQRLGLFGLLKGLGVFAVLAKINEPLGNSVRFMPRIGQIDPIGIGQTYGQNQRGRVALFTGCLMNTVYAHVHRATITALVANGWQVVVPRQTCCGALAHHAGETDLARRLTRQNMAAYGGLDVDWVVVNSAGCGAMLQGAHHLFDTDQEAEQEASQARAYSQKHIDVMALLAQHPLQGLDFESVGSHTGSPTPVAYHAACHLYHGQGVQDEPERVLRQLPQISLVPLRDASQCCGSAGVYNLAHPELSSAVLAEKMQAIAEAKPAVVVAGNPGCMLQLETGAREHRLMVDVKHPVELVAEAYDQG